MLAGKQTIAHAISRVRKNDGLVHVVILSADKMKEAHVGLELFDKTIAGMLDVMKEYVALQYQKPARQTKLWMVQRRANLAVRIGTALGDSHHTMTIGDFVKPGCQTLVFFVQISERVIKEIQGKEYYFHGDGDLAYTGILLFVKYYDPVNAKLQFVTTLSIPRVTNKLSCILPLLVRAKELPASSEISIYHEKSAGVINLLDTNQTCTEAGLMNGDIICFQLQISPNEDPLMATCVAHFKNLTQHCVVKFYPKTKFGEKQSTPCLIQIPLSSTYDTLGKYTNQDPKCISLYTNTVPSNVLSKFSKEPLKEIIKDGPVSFLYSVIPLTVVHQKAIWIDPFSQEHPVMVEMPLIGGTYSLCIQNLVVQLRIPILRGFRVQRAVNDELHQIRDLNEKFEAGKGTIYVEFAPIPPPIKFGIIPVGDYAKICENQDINKPVFDVSACHNNANTAALAETLRDAFKNNEISANFVTSKATQPGIFPEQRQADSVKTPTSDTPSCVQSVKTTPVTERYRKSLSSRPSTISIRSKESSSTKPKRPSNGVSEPVPKGLASLSIAPQTITPTNPEPIKSIALKCAKNESGLSDSTQSHPLAAMQRLELIIGNEIEELPLSEEPDIPNTKTSLDTPIDLFRTYTHEVKIRELEWKMSDLQYKDLEKARRHQTLIKLNQEGRSEKEIARLMTAV